MKQNYLGLKTSFLPFSVYLCFFIFLTSCDKPDIPEFQPDPEITLGDISNRLVARIYFDATLSMQGFVVPDSTLYTQICPYLESIIVSGWKNGKVDFFRFGEQVESIDRDTYLQAGYEVFYKQENIYRETFIQKVIDHESQLAEESPIPEEPIETDPSTEKVNDRKAENSLVVIVTDLFQDRGDINLLVAQLKEKYIKNGIKVGLLGLRSQFDGTVYDTGIGQAPMPYRSDPSDPETFRPFYLLVLGEHADIAHYFDSLIKKGFSDAETIIFSQHLITPLLSFEDVNIRTLENLIRYNIVEEPDSRFKEYRIWNRNSSSKISAKMNYELLPHTIPFDSNIFEPKIIVEHNRNSSERRAEITQATENCLEVTSTFVKNENGDELIVDFALDSQVLPRRTVYFYKVALLPKTYQIPEWCSEWDMGTGRNGAKTLNLVNFVDGLTDIAVSEYKPKIAQFHFYIKKR